MRRAHAGIRQRIVDGLRLAPGRDEAAFAQLGQMLGQRRLAQRHDRSKADTDRSPSVQLAQDHQAVAVGQRLEEVRRFGAVRFELLHIHVC